MRVCLFLFALTFLLCLRILRRFNFIHKCLGLPLHLDSLPAFGFYHFRFLSSNATHTLIPWVTTS